VKLKPKQNPNLVEKKSKLRELEDKDRKLKCELFYTFQRASSKSTLPKLKAKLFL
jgi:hypothetical protein